jgi:hypothetical protein
MLLVVAVQAASLSAQSWSQLFRAAPLVAGATEKHNSPPAWTTAAPDELSAAKTGAAQ